MNNINSIMIVGNLVRDPVKKDFTNSKVVEFTIASNDYITGKDGVPKKETCFVSVKCWGFLADRTMTLVKGNRVLVDGRLKLESWKSKDGTEASKIVIIASQVEKIGIDKNAMEVQTQMNQSDDNDLPF